MIGLKVTTTCVNDIEQTTNSCQIIDEKKPFVSRHVKEYLTNKTKACDSPKQ